MPSGLNQLLAVGAISVFLGIPAAPASAAAEAEEATVTDTANVRGRPNTESAILAELPVGTEVNAECWTDGELVDRTTMWLHLSEGGWIHSTLVTPVDVPECTESTATATDTRFTGFLYDNCDEAPGEVRRGEPGYGPHLDRDDDGTGCEWDE